MDPFKVLGISTNTRQEDIVKAWVSIVAGWRPGQEYPANYGTAMLAARELLSLSVSADTDWLLALVALVETDVANLRDTPDIEPGQIWAIGDRLKHAPKTVPHARLAGVPECQAAQNLIEELLPLEEFAVARDLLFGTGDFDILWKPHGMTGKGCIIHASIQGIPQEQRDVWPSQPAPAYRLRINLPYWLLADDIERERLIHHELCHASRIGGKIRTLPHDIEENLDTARKYGARDLRHARLMEAALSHPRTQAMLAADPDGQLNFDLSQMRMGATGKLELVKAV